MVDETHDEFLSMLVRQVGCANISAYQADVDGTTVVTHGDARVSFRLADSSLMERYAEVLAGQVQSLLNGEAPSCGLPSCGLLFIGESDA